jgi:hypothetical protein
MPSRREVISDDAHDEFVSSPLRVLFSVLQYVRSVIATVPPDLDEDAAKALIIKQIDAFIRVSPRTK